MSNMTYFDAYWQDIWHRIIWQYGYQKKRWDLRNAAIKFKMLKKNISNQNLQKFHNQHFSFVFLEISFVFSSLDFPKEDEEGKLWNSGKCIFFIDWNDISLGEKVWQTFLQIGTPYCTLMCNVQLSTCRTRILYKMCADPYT